MVNKYLLSKLLGDRGLCVSVEQERQIIGSSRAFVLVRIRIHKQVQ
jgi:hypothetical protein